MDAEKLKGLLADAPVVPILPIPNNTDVGSLARTLERAGIKAAEVTLRTPDGLRAISDMKAAAPDLLIGAATIINKTTLEAAIAAGADYYVSPGWTPEIHATARANEVCLLPGVATPTEAMMRYDEGYSLLKLYPTDLAGGASLLKSLSGPLPYLSFMTVGGIDEDNMTDYTQQPNVTAIGGTWLVTKKELQKEKWLDISARVRKALKLAGA